MKAAFVKVPFQFEIREVEIPRPGDDEILVKVKACGVCGTELHISRYLARDWMPFGHEVVGEVVELGRSVRTSKKGDKVVIENATFCGICEVCKNGKVEFCENPHTLNGKGGFAEYICVHKNSLYPFEGLSFKEAVLAEPLTVALDLTGVSDISLNSDVAIFGPGSIGLMAVKLARLRGARKVYLTGLSEDKARLRMGKELGADKTIEVNKIDLVKFMKKEFPKGMDRVLVTSPPKTLLDAIQIAGYGGIVSFIGIELGEGSKITFDVNEFHFKKLQMRASYAVPNLMFPKALDLLKRKVIDAQKLITHSFDLEHIEEAIKTVIQKREEVIKVAVLPEV
ncbi:MAG: Sorbitol dehydrogenase [candidate division WS2 bacterium]|nr:Sorbitol dehydrogenase [Candidatus Psychracetigena formicireducens]